MVLRRVGEKKVSILVNGTQEASYTQETEQADYNIETGSSLTLSMVHADGGDKGLDIGDTYSTPDVGNRSSQTQKCHVSVYHNATDSNADAIIGGNTVDSGKYIDSVHEIGPDESAHINFGSADSSGFVHWGIVIEGIDHSVSVNSVTQS